MKPFLLELAERMVSRYGKKIADLTIIFPNRRASLYFRKYISGRIDKPIFSPRLLTIEDFIKQFTVLQVPHKIDLIDRLHKVYNEVVFEHHQLTGKPLIEETFDQFFFWGEMLLRDFEEVDKYMVNSETIFKDLSNQKELDAVFEALTEEQREFLRTFWISFDEKDSINKNKFLHLWRLLPLIYSRFKEVLRKECVAYEGMLQREVAENIKTLNPYPVSPEPMIHFAGFNALTAVDEKILSFFVDSGLAEVHWDIDSYYFHNNTQEAGRFFREYQEHPVLRKTFGVDVPANFSNIRNINLYGASQPVGQAKLLGQLLQEKLAAGFRPEETLIVLPDEKLLIPVLHGVSDKVEKLNVTMGFPLTHAPLYSLLELLVELQLTRKEDCFNHRSVLTLLGHPYVVAADAGAAHAKRKEMLKNNWVLVPENYLRNQVELHRLIFQSLHTSGTRENFIVDYLKGVVEEIGKLETVEDFDKEYCYHFLTLLTKMGEVMPMSVTQRHVDDEINIKPLLKAFLRLFRQLIKSEKLPFSGEPLAGLQVMGVLETRNLDYKNIFVLSLNEGSFPAFNNKGSYIPHNIRKAYGLPTIEHQDSIYGYLFYRMLQRAENVFLFYNTQTDDLGQGEMSRYLQQLLYESNLRIKRFTLHNALQPKEISTIEIKKDQRVYDALATYCEGRHGTKSLSPSALNDYLECRLKFYFKYIARIREANQVEEELDARVLGNFLHKVMELFYKKVINEKRSTLIEAEDIAQHEGAIDQIVDRAFIDNYSLNPQRKVHYEGQRLVVKEIVKRFIDRILAIDKDYAPFTMEALERNDVVLRMQLNTSGNPVVLLGGSIDRADRKDDTVRVIDYKTGKDQLSFGDITTLLDREAKQRNKAAFQTLMYSLLYKKNLATPGVKIIPGLMNRVNLFNEDFRFGLKQENEYLEDATPLLLAFETLLQQLVTEIFDEQVTFDQTSNTEVCEYCPYHRICYR